jgi:type III restriction enzyme
MSQRLDKKYEALREFGTISLDLPNFLTNNLNKKFELRPYQKEAIASFIFHFEKDPKRNNPTQLLFHMATGSGKTLLMAAKIIYLYSQGYRNFIFFVNSTNILNKTKSNFLNILSSKYLFSEKIIFNEKRIKINDVQNFEITNNDDINILFTTIQGLHIKLNYPQENAITFHDFNDKIVLLSDEAHHINAMTKKNLSKEEKINMHSWEMTINRIFNSNSKNILLEFTATIDLDNVDIATKYDDKILYNYTLKQFREDKYSKEVKVLESDIPPIERAIQSIVLSQYRRKVAEKYKINLKPVILMKSKTIFESEEFEKEFFKKIKNLKKSDIKKIKNTKSIILQNTFQYFDKNKISLDNLILELQEEFGEDKGISVNSKNESEEKQILVNTLEDKHNEIRVVFAVDKLNEGWDVLNLFDIVRLYDTRDVRAGRPGKTTMAEAQLIGRGARYYPIELDDSSDKYKRKFDSDLKNELRVIEELYYHSSYNPKYIQELHYALRETGMMPETTKEIEVKIKDDFKKTSLWKSGHIFVNKKIPNTRSNIKNFSDISLTDYFKYSLHTGFSTDATIFESKISSKLETKTLTLKLTDLGKSILEKAIHKLDFYRFDNLLSYFPKLTSISNFFNSENFLGMIQIEVTGLVDQLKQLTPEEKLDIAISTLGKLSIELQHDKTEYVGTKEFYPIPIKTGIKNKLLNFHIEHGSSELGLAMNVTNNQELQLDLSTKSWYIHDENYGTSEEKYFVKLIHNTIEKIKQKYDDVYLLRNERFFQIHQFSDGRSFEPDFVLFLKEKGTGKNILYQLFIEPKGDHLIATDKWKEEFLEEIESNYKITEILDNNHFRIIGLPFYNEKITKSKFLKKFEKELKFKI